MTTPWVPPRRSYHLRMFALALLGVVLCLIGVLFGLRMETVTHGNGYLEARYQQEIRVTVGGVVELGWYEGEITTGGRPMRVRVDRAGNGVSDPRGGEARLIQKYKLRDGPDFSQEHVAFHKLEAGDILWPGQPLGYVAAEDLIQHVIAASGRRLSVPAEGDAWLAAKIYPAHGERMKPGDRLALLVPADARTGQAGAFKAVLNVDEKHAAHLAPGQDVRLYSIMYTQRLFGHADAVIERLEPLAEPAKNGERFVRVHAKVLQAPFPLRLGSSVKAEVVGKKQIYRVILEQ
jgi:hypothetical protein